MSAVIFESISCLVNHKQTFELSHVEQCLYNLHGILINVFTRKYLNTSILDALCHIKIKRGCVPTTILFVCD